MTRQPSSGKFEFWPAQVNCRVLHLSARLYQNVYLLRTKADRWCRRISAPPQSLDLLSGRSLDDWQTFYDGAERLVEYLNYVGFGGQMLTVMADGSTIYPSALVDPNLRYDSGAQFENGQDPIRKDYLELVLRLFDRDTLKMIPSLQFSAPLPELEDLLRHGGDDAVGIQLIGSEGETYTDKFPARRGWQPGYNPLNPHVQQAILNVPARVSAAVWPTPVVHGYCGRAFRRYLHANARRIMGAR